MTANRTEKIEFENVNHPGHVKPVDPDIYGAMKRAFLKILPKRSPGLTMAEVQERVIALYPRNSFLEEPRRAGGQRPFSLIWRRKGLLRERKPDHFACVRRDVNSRLDASRSTP